MVTKKQREILIAKAAALLGRGFGRVKAAAYLSRTEGVSISRARNAIVRALTRKNSPQIKEK